MIKSIIIDDEAQARKVIRNMLDSDFPNVQVVGEGDDVPSAIDSIKELKPDLVFLDIQLRTGSGFDVLTAVQDESFEVVFVTAFDQYALTAFQFSAVGYLLKPIRLTELKKVIERVESHFLLHDQARNERLRILIENYEENGQVRKLIVQNMNGFQVITLREIVYLGAEVNYTRFILKNGEQILVSKTLKDYEKLLLDFGFFRIHQSYLINLGHIKNYKKGEGGIVTMINGDELPVSRRKKAGFIKKFLG